MQLQGLRNQENFLKPRDFQASMKNHSKSASCIRTGALST